MSMTRWTRGFCCSSGRDINSSMDSEPELSRSSFLNRFPRRLISSASNVEHISIGSDVSFPCRTTDSYIKAKSKHYNNILIMTSTGLLQKTYIPHEGLKFAISSFAGRHLLVSATKPLNFFSREGQLGEIAIRTRYYILSIKECVRD